MKTVFVGIDNGLSGGIAVLSPHGLLIGAAPMPTIERPTGKEIAPLELCDTITDIAQCRPLEMTIAVEACPKHARDKAAMRSMAMSFGIIVGAIRCDLAGAKVIYVESGNSRGSWQRMIGYAGGEGSVDTKKAALAKARQLWPDETWLATPRCTKPHTGMIDAALIAEFARIKNL